MQFICKVSAKFKLEAMRVFFCQCSWRLHIITTELVVVVAAQTEGDTGYDYNDAYEDSDDESSGLLAVVLLMICHSNIAIICIGQQFRTFTRYQSDTRECIYSVGKSQRPILVSFII